MSAALSHRFASLDGSLSGSFARDSITSPNQDESFPVFGASLPNPAALGVPMPADHSMASQIDAQPLQIETHSCTDCKKQFSRLCDLNKHAKSHSRPFKCTFQTCKYWSLGWPTAKELERHVNDKHSTAPRTYPCQYPQCTYESKRQSNCKQHMEKAHGYNYVRSKSNGRIASRRLDSQSVTLQTDLPSHSSQSFPLKSSSFKPSLRTENDFVLFPQGGHHAPSDDDYDDDGNMELDDSRSQGSDVVIPWTSPDTRLRRRETFLQNFTQQFSRHEDDLPIDPQLSTVGTDTSTMNPTENKLDQSSRAEYTARTAQTASINGQHVPSPTTYSMPTTPYTMALQQRPGGSVPPSHHGGSSVNLKPSAVASSMHHITSQKSVTSKRKEEDDEEDEHPPKKFKLSPRFDFKDNQMPDIFVAAYPETYNRNTRSQYQSCETNHKDISTLVRHLGRPPHRLICTEKYIHSFDVTPVELSHARRGLCRRCWEVFSTRESLESHISLDCEKVSKGKREKWRILFDTFTPLATDPAPPAHNHGNQSANTNQRLFLSDLGANDRGVHRAPSSADEDDSPVAPPSPTTVDLGPRIPMEDEGEIERLRLHNRHLRAFSRLAMIEAQAGRVLDLSQLVSFAPLRQAIEGSREFGSGLNTREPGRLTFPVHASLKEETPDTASLVGHMNSQPTDVDARGMMDDIQQTLPRTSSGMSGSDRSTLRHVSNSPRQPFETYTGEQSSNPNPASAKPSRGLTPTRHQPTSLPDSGYGSDMKKTSIAGADLVDQTKLAHPQPQHTSAPIPQDQTPRRESISPFVKNGGEGSGQQPGLPTDLPLDLTLPSSGMSPSPFMTPGEADAYYFGPDLLDQFGEYSQPSSSSFQS